MARVRASADIGSRDARRRLRARREPYFFVIERGLSLGYRKSKEGGTWVARRYDSGLRRHFEDRVGSADDSRDADGTEVLNFAQAQRKLLLEAHAGAERSSGRNYTVADAVSDYLDYLRSHRKSADDAKIKFDAYVVPRLGEKRLVDLKAGDFEEWLDWAMKRQARRKPKKPKPPPKRVSRKKSAEKEKLEAKKVDAAEQRRRRKATVNRIIAMFKACLNHAHNRKKTPSREAWAGLKKFSRVDGARLRWLTVDESKRLINACSPSFRRLVQAGLMTGCREGELLALRARDFDPHTETLLVADSKSGKPRRVPLTKEGTSVFEALTAGRKPDEPLFARADGTAWHRVAIIRAMQEACAAGKIDPPATFYTLRHTYASHLVQESTPLMYVASALGHRDTRMVEKHYGHFAPSHVADTIRAKLPTFGIQDDQTIRRIARR
jgi:integrase